MTRLQPYHLKVPGASSAAGLAVVSFEATERLGEPYSVKIRLTHPMDLDRMEYVRRDATFSINPGDGSEPRQFSGCIFRFSKTRQTRDFCAYEMELRPKVALLTLTKASRVYQRKTAPQIIEAILRRHGLEGHQFAFKIRRQYPEHPFRLQYQMSDWDYIRLLMEQEGLYSYFLPSPHGTVFGDVFHVCDDIDHYIYQPELRVPYRETAGLESGIETVFDIQTHVHTVPESFRTADYNPADSYERKEGEANVARKETGNYGQSYVYGTHHLDMAGAKWEAQLRHEAALAGQIVYEGQSNVLDLRPARILRMDINLPDAPHGQVITEVVHIGARDQAYRNTYQAIPSDRRFRLPIDESRWPRIAGTLSGRVTSPGKYKYAYLTQHGLYVVRLDLDFDKWPNGGESVPMRLAKPFAGARQTGFHFPLIDGTEVAIAFRDGDPNKPYIAHAHHHSRHEDLITNRDRWLSRNVIRTQANNKLRFEDWEGQEGVKLSTDYGGKTQLNMGYLVDHKRQKRGEGFELRTSGWGALRAGRGMLISADDQPNANGRQLEMASVQGLLQQALQQTEALAAAAKAAEAVTADYDRQKALLNESLSQLKKASILISAPAGMALASRTDLQCTAAENLIATAGGHADFSMAKRFTLAAGELVSAVVRRDDDKDVTRDSDRTQAVS
ncbi:type VI secretion system Vgr family protein [Cupriavidus pauculus]|uniref:type VI secretion system Vgr family protein n=1 Tax=Cupriavidus pauculus TaxID=82633 RepID=UPI00385773CF